MKGTTQGLSAVWSVVVAGSFAVAAVVGCSASGSDASLDDETAATDPNLPGSSLPPPSSTGDDGTDTAPPSKKDAGGKDSSVDAGPPPPVPGTACAKPDEIVKKQCGACGEQSTVCIAGADGGPGAWTEYSPCTGEIADGCVPGTTVTEACGNCGTVTRTCSKYCGWSAGTCTGQPADSCVPLAIDLSTAGCGAAETYRQRSCKADCTWNNFSSTCSAAPTSIEVPPTVGGVSGTIVTLRSAKTAPKLTGTCPNATLSTTVTSPYEYVHVHNPNAKAAVVTVFNSLAPGGVVFHTVLAAYAGAQSPATDAARKACLAGGVNTFGDDALTGDFDFASLGDGDAVTVPANGTVTIYVGAYSKFDAAKPAASTGPVRVSVRLDALD
jgi:hypothetical protein